MRIGIILTYDNAIDTELPRWCPPGVTVHVARTGYPELDENIRDLDDQVADPGQVRFATRSLIFLEPAAIAFACTSGSFRHGPDGERALREVMLEAGAERAITTSGAVVDGLRAVGARRVAVGTPYDAEATERLGQFLTASGFEVVALENAEPRPGEDLNDITEADLEALAERIAVPAADAIFLSCTALETFELIPRLESRFGRPVLTSTQVTMWALLAAVGAAASIADQRLFQAVSPVTPG